MIKEEEKQARELRVFKHFLKDIGVHENLDTIRNEAPQKPDISYTHPQNGPTAFELLEICSPVIAKTTSKLLKSSSEKESVVFIRPESTSSKKIKDKLKSVYVTNLPIELLCYTSGRINDPDDLVISKIMPIIECATIKFRRIWLLGEEKTYLLYDGCNGGIYLRYG